MIDWPTLISWLVFYVAIPFVSASGAYLIQRKRDDIAWQREKEKLQEQFKHDVELITHQTKQELFRQQEQRVRSEILPTIWERMKNAIEKVMLLTRPLSQISFGNWSDDETTRFLSGTRFSDPEKQAILHSDNKEAEFIKIDESYRMKDASKALSEFRDYTLNNKIVIDEKHYSLLIEMSNLLSDTFVMAIAASATRDIGKLSNIRGDFQSKSAILAPPIEQQIRAYLSP